MALTAGQRSKVQAQEGYKWLKVRGDRNEAVPATLIKTKLTAAIEAALGPNMATDSAISELATAAGTPWGQFYEAPKVYTGKISIHAKTEVVVGVDKQLAQALRAIFNDTATGRSGPKTGSINHIHVGGNAHRNIIFDTDSSVVLGIVDFHMDSSMKGGERNEVAKVERRKGGPTQDVFIQNDLIY